MYRNVTSEESKYKITDSKKAVMNSGKTYKSLKVLDIKIKNIERVKEAKVLKSQEGGQSCRIQNIIMDCFTPRSWVL